MIEDEETIHFFVTNTIYIQNIDSTYDSVNFDDFVSTLSYYKRLRRFSRQNGIEDSSEELDQRFDNMTLVLTQEGSKISAEAQAHSIMRSAAEKIHKAFQKLNRNSYEKIVIFVSSTIVESDSRLLGLAAECLLAKLDEMKQHQTL